LALLPATDQTGRATPLAALADALQRGLDATGRFYVVPRARLTVWLLERSLSSGDVLASEIMSEAASALEVVYVAQPVLRDTGDTAVVELRLLVPARPQTPVTTAVAILSEAAPTRQRPISQPAAAVSTPPSRPESPPAAVIPPSPGPTDGLTTLKSLLSADPLILEKLVPEIKTVFPSHRF